MKNTKKQCKIIFCKIDVAHFILFYLSQNVNKFSTFVRIIVLSIFINISQYDENTTRNKRYFFEIAKIYKNLIVSCYSFDEFSNNRKIFFEWFFVIVEIYQVSTFDETFNNKRFYEFFIVIAKLRFWLI